MLGGGGRDCGARRGWGWRGGGLDGGDVAFCRKVICLGMMIWRAGVGRVVPVWDVGLWAARLVEGRMRVWGEVQLLRDYGDAYRCCGVGMGRLLAGSGRLE